MDLKSLHKLQKGTIITVIKKPVPYVSTVNSAITGAFEKYGKINEYSRVESIFLTQNRDGKEHQVTINSNLVVSVRKGESSFFEGI